MGELARRIHERVLAAADEDGRLPAPDFVEWDVWPLEGPGVVKRMLDPVDEEIVRGGEGDKPCTICDDQGPVIWTNGRWNLRSMDSPTGVPLIVWLVPVEHLDLPDLDDEQASELGVLSVRITRVLEAMDGIGRVHLNRWGDGGSHAHVMFLARPHGLPQVRGSFALIWDDVLPPFPEDEWRDWMRRFVEAFVNDTGGTAVG